VNNDNPAFWQDLAKKAPAGCRILSPTRRSGAFFDFVNDLISDEKSSWSKPIRVILSVTAVPVHLPVIKSYYDYVAKSREIPTPAAKQCLLLDN
jgi:hypothetical protein